MGSVTMVFIVRVVHFYFAISGTLLFCHQHQRASVISSTLLTDTPARYISTRASSTEDYLLLYRSMIAVSKGSDLNFGTLMSTSPAFVWRVRVQ